MVSEEKYVYCKFLADELTGFDTPYGGTDWVQKEGWEIREMIRKDILHSIINEVQND